MKKQIVNVSLVQSAKVIAVVYLLLSLPLVALMLAVAPMIIPGVGGVVALVMIPLVYALASFLGVIIGGWLYNLAAGMVGGIEYTTSDVSPGQSVTG